MSPYFYIERTLLARHSCANAKFIDRQSNATIFIAGYRGSFPSANIKRSSLLLEEYKSDALEKSDVMCPSYDDCIWSAEIFPLHCGEWFYVVVPFPAACATKQSGSVCCLHICSLFPDNLGSNHLSICGCASVFWPAIQMEVQPNADFLHSEKRRASFHRQWPFPYPKTTSFSLNHRTTLTADIIALPFRRRTYHVRCGTYSGNFRH